MVCEVSLTFPKLLFDLLRVVWIFIEAHNAGGHFIWADHRVCIVIHANRWCNYQPSLKGLVINLNLVIIYDLTFLLCFSFLALANTWSSDSTRSVFFLLSTSEAGVKQNWLCVSTGAFMMEVRKCFSACDGANSLFETWLLNTKWTCINRQHCLHFS